MALKEAIVVLIDVGETSSSLEPNLKKSIDVISNLIQQKLMHSAKDQIGIILFGSEVTKNDLSEDGYQNINVIHDIITPSFETLDILKSIKPEGKKGDFIDAMIVGMDLLEKKVSTRSYSKRMFLITDAGSPVNTSDIDQIVKTFIHKDIRLNVIGLNFDINQSEKSDIKISNENILKEIVDKVSGVIVSIEEAIENVYFYLPNKPPSREVFTGWFEISKNLKINVKMFDKTFGTTKIPTLKKLSKLAKESDEPGSMNVITETTYRSYDDPHNVLDKIDLDKGYKYGKTIVPVTKVDERKYITDPGIKLIGFTRRDEVPRHYFCSTVECMVAADKYSQRALGSFIKGMIETDNVAIVRYVKGKYKGSNPQLGVLTPQLKNNYYFLYYNKLPFSEDIRQYTFSSLLQGNNVLNKKFMYIPTDEQKECIDDLIKSMDLIFEEEEEDGEKYKVELFKPKEILTPSLQHFYKCIIHRAFHPNDKLPDLDSRIKAYIEPFPPIMEKCKDVFKRMKNLFPLKKSLEDEEKSGRKRFWEEAFGDVNDEIKLTSFINDDDDKDGKKFNKENDDGKDSGKKKKDNSITLDSLISGGVEDVGNINPIDDFNSMIKRRDVDLVDKAIEQMIHQINKLVTESIRDSHYSKAIECLKALRKGCIEEEEADQFNQCLIKMKSDFKDKSRDDFWNLIVQNNITLISNDESKDVNVTTQEANEFLHSDDIDSNQNNQKDSDNDDDNVESLFDQLE